MTTFADLNTYAQGTLDYDIAEIQVSRSVGNTFASPYATWELVRQIGPLTGSGVKIIYDVSAVVNTTVAFNSTAFSNNTLTVTNPSTGVYHITGILDVIDYISAEATIQPEVSYSGNVSYQVTYNNTNASSGNVVVDYVGTP